AGEGDAAVLPPPMFLTLIAEHRPVVLVARLLQHDPIELVVRPSAIAARGVVVDAPLRERLERLRGIRLAIPPHPPTRLPPLYASVGLDADRDVQMVILHGKEQNEAYRAGEVDALYAHTPYVERAIVHDGAVVVVNQSQGDIPALSGRLIHALAFRRPSLSSR